MGEGAGKVGKEQGRRRKREDRGNEERSRDGGGRSREGGGRSVNFADIYFQECWEFLTTAKIFFDKSGDHCSTHVGVVYIWEILFSETCFY